MILFLILVLFLTIGALNLFILPILPLSKGHNMKKYVKYFYIVFVCLLFTAGVPFVYGKLGTPELRDYPLKERDLFSAETSVKNMAKVRRLERYLEQTPDDGPVWEELGRTYRAAGRYKEASTAFRNAIEWGVPEDIKNWHALAETLIQANNGRISGEAQKAFENVLRYRPDDPKAIYFLGLARLQNDEPYKALAMWRYLEQLLSANDPWLTVIHERIRELGGATSINPRKVSPQEPVPLSKRQ